MTIDNLKTECRWVLWRKVTRGGKVTKPPFQPNGRLAHNDDPQTWNTFSVCEAAFLKGGFDGIGMELGGGLDKLGQPITMVTGVDGDACRDEDGKFSPEARAVIIGLNSYAEYSPSDHGFHCWTLADLGGRKNVQRPSPGFKMLEVKGAGAYHTFTGRHLAKTPQEVLPRQSEIDALYAKVNCGTSSAMTVTVPQDEQERFEALWAGDLSSVEGDHSRGDFALCCIVARRYKNDILKMIEEFCKSGLVREKWLDRTDYASSTLLKAVMSNKAGFQSVPDLDEDTPADWTIEPLPHREDGWIPSREISLIGGSSGGGKTHLLIYILTRLGGGVFGHDSKKRDFALLLHDRGRSALKRTCRAAKLSASVIEDIMDRAIQLTKDQKQLSAAQCLEAAIQTRPQAKIWVIEGLDLWMKSISDVEVVSEALGDLVDVARQHNVAVVATVGSPKQKENDRYSVGRDQFMGSVAWGRKAETCILLRQNTADKSVRDVVVMTRNTEDEFFWFTWREGVLTLTEKPAEMDDSADKSSALQRMEVQVFTATQQGEELKYRQSFGPVATFFRWRKVAQAEGKVTVSGKKWYRAATGMDCGEASYGVGGNA
ncbi:MAG: hypothetical protein WA182_19500 [Candidatus Sulfotelmatobacter sp.]